MWNSGTLNEVLVLKGHQSTVTGLAFNRNGSLLASSSWDSTVRVWDVAAGGKLLFTLQTEPAGAEVLGVSFSADGK